MQVQTLGLALGLGFTRIVLSAEGEPVAALPAAAPRLLLSFGRAARPALRLAGKLTPRPMLVHLGTPGHTPITAFDLIFPMPQDDYPQAPNVRQLRLPLNGATLVAAPATAGRFCIVIIGGPSRHYRMTCRAIRRLLRFAIRLAGANGEALHVVTSPRTPEAVLAELGGCHGFTLHGFGQKPFAELLQCGARFVVTADSASMLAEALRTGAPVWLFDLPRRRAATFPQHAVDFCLGRGLRHFLVRRGLLGGGADFARWHRWLRQEGVVLSAGELPEAALRGGPAGAWADTDLLDCQALILDRLANGGGTAG